MANMDLNLSDHMPDQLEEVKKETRLRVWIAEFYPESTKPDWEKIWSDNFICAAVSPVHDRDVWEDDTEDHACGELKKAHRHVVFRFSGSKSFMQVWEILKLISLNDKCPPPQIPHGDITACVQYLVHYNHKNKAQYLISDIISLNGFDYQRYFKLNFEQEGLLFDALMDFIDNNKIIEYWVLMKLLRDKQHESVTYEEMYRYSRSHTILLSALVKSRKYSPKDFKT